MEDLVDIGFGDGRLLQALGHRPKRLGQIANFIVALERDLDFCVEMSVGDLLRHAGQKPQWAR